MTMLGKWNQLISAETKDKLKPALNQDIRIFCDNDYLFGENISESLKLAKENYKLAQNLTNSKSTLRHKSSRSPYRASYKRRYDGEAPFSYFSSKVGRKPLAHRYQGTANSRKTKNIFRQSKFVWAISAWTETMVTTETSKL